jgi:antitoxin HicB
MVGRADRGGRSVTDRYSVFVQWSDRDGEFVATCPELEGLTGMGGSADEAIAVLREAIAMAVEVYEEEGRTIPEPRLSEEFSGQFRLRVPKHLHAALAAVAEQEGVSLNTLAVSYLAGAVGRGWVSGSLTAAGVMVNASGSTHEVIVGNSTAVHKYETSYGSTGNMAKGKNYHVVPSQTSPGKFVVKQEGKTAPLTRASTQAQAIEKAKPLAKAAKGELVIHGRDGKIRDKDSYGNDPHPPKDRKH